MIQRGARLAPRFIGGSRGQLFIQTVAPEQRQPDTAVILLPPITEEMNKSRRMYALQAQCLAEQGMLAVVPDLYGLGDSEGSIAEVGMEVWRDDLARIAGWIVDTFRPQNVHVLALRSAALLCDLIDRQMLPVKSWVLWSPIGKGSRLVKDLYRQALISLRNHGDATTTAKSLRERTRREGRIEISGYEFSIELIDQLDNAALPDSLPPDLPVTWFDVRASVSTEAQRSEPRIVLNWNREFARARYEVVVGPPFWHTAEISTVPELIDATTAVLRDATRG